ncbi:hypothetical protein [Vulcanococcus limneticus]|uniref:hypothetical protein n=1 Tax=Vulcanococcus limneticus TaxID=2170428 RepID=UPI00398C108F
MESPHGHLKRRIEQALLLRGSSDFETLAAYQAFLVEVAAGYNRPRQCRLEQDRPAADGADLPRPAAAGCSAASWPASWRG